MGIVNTEDVIAISIDGEVVCMKCLDPDELAPAREEDCIKDDEDTMIFCDRRSRCDGKQL